MKKATITLTRRDFIRGATCAALGAAIGLPLGRADAETTSTKARAVLIRHSKAVDGEGNVNADVIAQMIDDAVTELLDVKKPIDAWKLLVGEEDTVGIKSNVAGPPSTPDELEQVLANRIVQAGVTEEHVDIGDRDVLHREVFLNSTALINVRPMRTHHWSGVGSLIKNYIMFDPQPWDYHDNYCADLATLWNLPLVKGKTRLNVLVLLTPLFHGVGPHHYDPKYTWNYNGLLVGTDPVALDSIGLSILQAKRREHFGEDIPMKPTPHHVVFADTRHKLGTSDLSKIELIRLGWDKDILI